MELRHIRYFLAVAQENNFTRAAARMGIGQPPLSQQIRDLEKEIGTPLFYRVPHGAELTAAGQAFLAAVEPLPDQVAAACRAAQRAGRGETGMLRVGFTGSAAMNPLVPGAIRAFRRRYPEVELLLSEGNSTGLASAVDDGTIDLAFLRPGGISASRMHLIRFPDEPMIAALPLDHPAAGADSGAIDLAALSDETFVLTPRAIGPTLFDAAHEACLRAGFAPRLGQAVPQIASALSLVAAEEGVSIVPASMRQLQLQGLAYRDISGQPPLAQLALAMPSALRSAPAHNFLTLAREWGDKESCQVAT